MNLRYVTRLVVLLLAVFAFAVLSFERTIAQDPPAAIREVITATCLDCHDSGSAEGNLDLENLTFDLSASKNFAQWVKIHDRVAAGEMPPADYGELPDDWRGEFTRHAAEALTSVNLAERRTTGRVQYRRINRIEYENTLRDLFGAAHLDVAGILPADNSAHGFDNVGAALDLSYVQMARYLQAANEALDRAMVLGPKPELQTWRLEALHNGRLSKVARKGKEAVVIDQYVGLLRQPNTAQTPWWFSKFSPPVDGHYRLRMKAFGFYWDRGKVKPAGETHVVSFQARFGSNVRTLASFDLPRTREEATVLDFTTLLKPGEQLQVRLETLDDRTKRGDMKLEDYSAPGVAIEWLEVAGPLIETWPPQSYTRLFGGLPSEPWTEKSGVKEPPLPTVVNGSGKRAKFEPAKRNKTILYHVVSETPKEDAARLIVSFATRAFRRPVQAAEIADIVSMVHAKLDQQYCFQEAMRVGFQAVLCSPEFLFLQEQPGRLDSHALASRLSYFLWNSMPDGQLMDLAADNQLGNPDVLRSQTERMLADPRSVRFVEDFTGQWLGLREITTTQPDEDLYPEFDQLLLDSMVAETHAYFTKMLEENLSLTHLVDSDFVMINGRLAELYEIPGVDGVTIRAVELPADSVRGGLLTQASVLKVTANGTTTSPVVRGAWVLDRILGRPAPPPPANVAAVEPDLRGTTTIRQQLSKHRDVAACGRCHQRIDPPGFALESFDVIGGYRDRYRSLGEGDTVDATFKGSRPVRYKLGLSVDCSGVASSGEIFNDIDDFRQILLKQEDQLARSLSEKLIVYATGAGIDFADRRAVDEILRQTKGENYPLRSLIHAVVQSDLFRTK